MSLPALKWLGGKSPDSPTGTGPWIADLLGEVEGVETYCEPYAGMLGILRQRTPAPNEIVNDIDGRVVNWWRCVRDEGAELSRLISFTPKSVEEHAWAMRAMDDPEETPVRRALAFTIAVQMAPGSRIGAFGISRYYRPWRGALDDGLLRLASRIRDVEITQGEAIPFIERWGRHADAMLYVDPPYQGTYGTGKGKHNAPTAYAAKEDVHLMTALQDAKSMVALSGYGAEWDHLGWEKRTYKTHTPNGSFAEKTPRVEVLWYKNFVPPEQSSLWGRR